MSKQILNALIEKTLNKEIKKNMNLIVRRYQNSRNAHIIVIEYKDIEDTILYNSLNILYSKTLDNIQKKQQVRKRQDAAKIALSQVRPKKLQERLKPLVEIVWEGFVKEYNQNLVDKSLFARKEGNKIIILQNSYNPRVTIALVNLVQKHARHLGFSRLVSSTVEPGQKSSNMQRFSRQTQFLHLGQDTVGTAQADILARAAGGAAPVGSSDLGIRNTPVTDVELAEALGPALEEAIQKGMKPNIGEMRKIAEQAIRDALESIDYDWKSREAIKRNSRGYQKEVAIVGTLGPSLLNPPGEEIGDFTNLRPIIEENITRGLKNSKDLKKFATEGSSQGPKEKIEANIIASLLDPLSKNPNIKVTKAKKAEPAKKDSSQVKGRKKSKKKPKSTFGVTRKSIKNSPSVGRAPNSPSAASAPLQLLGVLNQQLPRVVQGNMGVPALENRSGRFAGSVRVTDVTTTAGGFPSVGYTYQKSPYQTFEPGFAQGSVERDPRKLIDRSIREIAAQFVIGRLYTRRL
jgi:hypothetical protein